jgi:hypothetical protein
VNFISRIDDSCSRPPTTEELNSFLSVCCNPELDDSNVVRFERLKWCDVLKSMWFDQNPNGDLWIESLKSDDDVRRSLDYIGKSAKRDQSLFDDTIFLPFGDVPKPLAALH